MKVMGCGGEGLRSMGHDTTVRSCACARACARACACVSPEFCPDPCSNSFASPDDVITVQTLLLANQCCRQGHSCGNTSWRCSAHRRHILGRKSQKSLSLRTRCLLASISLPALTPLVVRRRPCHNRCHRCSQRRQSRTPRQSG